MSRNVIIINILNYISAHYLDTLHKFIILNKKNLKKLQHHESIIQKSNHNQIFNMIVVHIYTTPNVWLCTSQLLPIMLCYCPDKACKPVSLVTAHTAWILPVIFNYCPYKYLSTSPSSGSTLWWLHYKLTEFFGHQDCAQCKIRGSIRSARSWKRGNESSAAYHV